MTHRFQALRRFQFYLPQRIAAGLLALFLVQGFWLISHQTLTAIAEPIIAIIAPGSMGAAVGRRLAEHGADIDSLTRADEVRRPAPALRDA